MRMFDKKLTEGKPFYSNIENPGALSQVRDNGFCLENNTKCGVIYGLEAGPGHLLFIFPTGSLS